MLPAGRGRAVFVPGGEGCRVFCERHRGITLIAQAKVFGLFSVVYGVYFISDYLSYAPGVGSLFKTSSDVC